MGRKERLHFMTIGRQAPHTLPVDNELRKVYESGRNLLSGEEKDALHPKEIALYLRTSGEGAFAGTIFDGKPLGRKSNSSKKRK
jgi:hypothetical protein